MSLSEIPAWLQVTPGMFVGAAEAGARAGTALAEQAQHAGEFASEMALKNRSLDQSSAEFGAEQDLQQQKLKASAQEGTLDRALRGRTLDMEQNRFNTNTALDQAHLGVQQASLDLRNRTQTFNEIVKRMAAQNAADKHDQEAQKNVEIASGLKDYGENGDIVRAVRLHPMLLTVPELNRDYRDKVNQKTTKQPDPNVKTYVGSSLGGTGSPFESMPLSQATNAIPNLPDEARTNAFNRAIMLRAGQGSNVPPELRGGATGTPTGQFSSPADVAAAYKAGKISRADALKILKEQFGAK